MTANKEIVYSDYLDFIVDQYNKEIGNDPVAYTMLKGRLTNENYDQELNENFKKQMNAILEAKEEN